MAEGERRAAKVRMLGSKGSESLKPVVDVTLGEFVVTLLKMLMSTRKRVISRAIRPGNGFFPLCSISRAL